jgi:hypothetical protein
MQLNKKEAPESPDYAKPVVSALDRVIAEIKKQDIKPVFSPEIKVSSPKVELPKIDLKGIEKLLKTEIPKAFKDSIKLIPQTVIPEQDDAEMQLLIQELIAVTTEVRDKRIPIPQFPNKIAVTNPDGSLVGGSGGDGAILDGVNSAIKATVLDIGTQITTNDHGLVTNTVMHGLTTGGGGGYVDVKVNPSGALTVESTISGTVVAFAKSTEQYAINNKESTATYKYFGFQKSDGGWYIMRKTIATNIFEYVAGASAYSTAWTNRASQTYTDYATAF